MAPATTTATMLVGPVDNSTESGGAGESQEDMFAKIKDKFFNEINKIPREFPEGQEGGVGPSPRGVIGWVQVASLGSPAKKERQSMERHGPWPSLPREGTVLSAEVPSWFSGALDIVHDGVWETRASTM